MATHNSQPGTPGSNPVSNPGTVTTKPTSNPATNPGAPTKSSPAQGEGNPGYEFDKTQQRRTDSRETEMTAMRTTRPGDSASDARKPLQRSTGNTGNSTGNEGNAAQNEDADAARVNREVKPTGIGAAATTGADEAANVDAAQSGIDAQPETGAGRSPRPM